MNQTKKISLAAFFLALAMVLPFLTGQLQQIGSMLSPMHFPILLCGFICGGEWGLLIGLIAPILRSLWFGMPPMFLAICMSAELATYGFISGILYNKLPKTKPNLYISLVSAMMIGRVVWGLARLASVGFDLSQFGLSAFLAGAFTSAIPGIILQLILIPLIVMALNKQRHIM